MERIIAMQWDKGSRKYLVKWEGYADKDNTWEPMENLVGCAILRFACTRGLEKRRIRRRRRKHCENDKQ